MALSPLPTTSRTESTPRDLTAGAPFRKAAVGRATPPASRVGSTGARLAALVRRELGDVWRDRRLVLGGVFCLLLAAAAGFSEGQRLIAIRGEEQLLTAGWDDSVREQALRTEPMEIPSVRSASPLSPLANGLESVLPQRFFSTKERLRFGEGRAARSTIEALAGAFDASFVTAVAFSLLAVVLTYDGISGERASGTLALLLSYPVSRRLLFASKAVAAVALLWLWLLSALLVFAGAMLVSGLPLGDGRRWLMLAATAGVYLAAWALVTLAVSATTRRPAVSLLAALVLWAALVLIVPRLLPPIVSGGWGSERLVRVTLLEEMENQRLRQEYQDRVSRLFAKYAFAGLLDDVAQQQFLDAQQQAQADLDRERRELSARIWDEQRRIERAMERRALWLSALSPTALFEGAAAEIAQTGYRQRELFYSAARDYYQNIGVRLAESHPLYLSLDQNTRRGVAFSPSQAEILDRVEPLLLQFETPWATPSQTGADLLFPLGLLLAYCAVVSALGIRWSRRLDPRP